MKIVISALFVLSLIVTSVYFWKIRKFAIKIQDGINEKFYFSWGYYPKGRKYFIIYTFALILLTVCVTVAITTWS